MTSTSVLSSGVPYLNYSVDLEDPITGVKHVIAAFSPFLSSAEHDLKIEVLSGGLSWHGILAHLAHHIVAHATVLAFPCIRGLFGLKLTCMNRMYKVTSPSAEHKEAVIVRINVGFVGSFFDREQEFRLVYFMHQKGLYGKIYGKFDNGICYQYMKGRRLELKDVGEPHIARAVQTGVMETGKVYFPSRHRKNSLILLAQKFAEFHAVSRLYPEVRTPTHPKELYLPILNRLPIQYKDPAATLLAYKLFPDVEELREEYNFLINHPNIENVYNDQTMVYCHHDFIPNNLIFNEETEEVHIIDYEFAAWGYQIEDIGTHFSEFIGMEVSAMDASLLPNEDFQLKWIRIYLETWNELTEGGRAVSDAEVWNFYVKASCYSLLKYWNIICFVLASEQDNPDYIAQAKRLKWDSFEYAKRKFDIYLQIRDRILGLALMPTS